MRRRLLGESVFRVVFYYTTVQLYQRGWKPKWTFHKHQSKKLLRLLRVSGWKYSKWTDKFTSCNERYWSLADGGCSEGLSRPRERRQSCDWTSRLWSSSIWTCVLTRPDVLSMLYVTAKPGALTALQVLLCRHWLAPCAHTKSCHGRHWLTKSCHGRFYPPFTLQAVSAPAPVIEFPFSSLCRASVVLAKVSALVVTVHRVSSHRPPSLLGTWRCAVERVTFGDAHRSICVVGHFWWLSAGLDCNTFFVPPWKNRRRMSASDDESINGCEIRAPRRRNSPSDPTSRKIEDHGWQGMQAFGRCVPLVSKVEVKPRDIGQMLIRNLRMLQRLPSCRGIIVSLAAEIGSVNLRWTNVDTVQFWCCTVGWMRSIVAHLIPAKGVDFSSFEKVVKMIDKYLDNLGYHRVVFRCDNEPSILELLMVVKLAWTGDVVWETFAEGDPQSNCAAESSVNVVKGHVRSIKLAVESASGVEVPAACAVCQ